MSRRSRNRRRENSQAVQEELPFEAERAGAARGAGARAAVRWLLPPVPEITANWRAILWALGSVVLLRLCFPPFAIWPLGFVALVPWLWGLRRMTARVAFWISWIFGAVHILSIFSWLAVLDRFNPAIYLGIPLLAIFQGFFFAVKGGGMIFFARRLNPWAAFLAASLWWAGWEWFRSVGALGLPFALLGHTVRTFYPLVQVVSIGGVVLLSALVLLVNLSVMEMTILVTRRFIDPHAIGRAAIALGLVIFGAIYGAGVMKSTREEAAAGVPMRVALLQPNISQDEKFLSYASPDADLRRELQDRFTRDLFDMIEQIEPGSVDVIIAPESAFTQEGFDLDEALQRAIRERVAYSEAALITGGNDNVFYGENNVLIEDPQEALRFHEILDYELYGGFFVFQPDDVGLRMMAQYRKIHLMPFGETIPYFDMIPGLQEKVVQIGTFMRGESKQPPIFIDVDATPDNPVDAREKVFIAPSICFEDLFAYLSNRMARRGAQVHVNITNNGWFDPSLGSKYHYAFARLRAPETRLPMILCTNTGVSAVIDGTGRVIDMLPRLEEGTLVTTVNVPREPDLTLYARFGDWFGMLSFVLTIAGMVVLLRKNNQG